MEKYMTMKEAFECNDEDIPFIDGGFNCITKGSKKGLFNPGCVKNPSLLESLSDKWQVIKAEQKVLTADELVKNRIGESINDDEYLYDECLELAKDGIKNGQLKEWNRTKKLRQHIKTIFLFLDSHMDLINGSGYSGEYSAFKQTFNNYSIRG